MTRTNIDRIDLIPDPNTDRRLLPGFMVQGTNVKGIECYKIALRMAMHNFLTEEQREIIHMLYWQNMSKTEIGNRIGITPSAVCKRLKIAESILAKHAEFAAKVCITIEKTLAKENHPA